jgi:hypothetical protein
LELNGLAILDDGLVEQSFVLKGDAEIVVSIGGILIDA